MSSALVGSSSSSTGASWASGAGDDEPLPLAAAQRAELAVGELGQIEPLEHVGDHRPVVRGLATEVADVRAAAEQHVLEAGHVVGHHGACGT